MLTKTSMMQSLTIKESLTRTGKPYKNNGKQLKESNANTIKDKGDVDINFSKKSTIKMAEMMMEHNNIIKIVNAANLLGHTQNLLLVCMCVCVCVCMCCVRVFMFFPCTASPNWAKQ